MQEEKEVEDLDKIQEEEEEDEDDEYCSEEYSDIDMSEFENQFAP